MAQIIALWLIMVVLGIIFIARNQSKKEKNLGIVLLIVAVGIPLIGLSICGIILMSN